MIRNALDKLGGEQRLRTAPFEIQLTGSQDLSVAMQGRSPERPEPTPITERVAVDLASRRSGYEFKGYNYAYSRQHLRELRLPGGRTGFIDMRNAEGGWPPFAFAADGHLRHARALPQTILIDAIDHAPSLTMSAAPGATRRLAYRTAAGDRIDLWIDSASGKLLSAESEFDLPLSGRTTARWTWSDYRREGGMWIPGRIRTFVDGQELKSQSLSLDLSPDLELLRPPPGIEMGEPPAVSELRPFVPFGAREPRLEQLAPGVHLILGLRPGFRVMFVEFADHVVAIDAPAGWVELGQIPPFDDSRGGGIGELGDKMLRAVAKATGGKPVRFVALTHHHSDHIGGIRPLAAEGAIIVGASPAIGEVERFLGRDIADIRVDDRWVHRDSTMELQLVRLPDGNPKADGFLVAYLPRQRIAYVTGFFYPVEQGGRQPAESLVLASWFIDWLNRSGLEVDTLYNLHAGGKLQQWQWDELREIAKSGTAKPIG